jgi:hypothetical protein
MAIPKTLHMRDLKRGQRVILTDLNNNRFVVEVTSVGEGAASGRRIGPNGPEGRVMKIKSGALLCLEGELVMKWAGNLVPGDLVYTPGHQSGVQYGRAVLTPSGAVKLLRWDETKREWLKRPQELPEEVQWFGHDSEPGVQERFFARIDDDRARWLASPGRSRQRQRHGKERRWDLDAPEPNYSSPPPRGRAKDNEPVLVESASREVDIKVGLASAKSNPVVPPEVPSAPQVLTSPRETPMSFWARLRRWWTG